jgi:hypothetical protein
VRLVAVAQLVEHRIVAPKVAGSSPVGHPPISAYLSGNRGEDRIYAGDHKLR